jgi:hypothetical protein
MRLGRQRFSALDHFALAIFLASALSSLLAIYGDIQVFKRFYAASSQDDPFTLSGSPISHAMLPIRLVLMVSLLVCFIGVRSRKLGGRLLSTLVLLLLIGLYLLWWRHSFHRAEASRHFGETITHTLYLMDANWIDIGVFVLSIAAFGWVVVTLKTQLKGNEGKVLQS